MNINNGNNDINRAYVVGILSPSTTLYIDPGTTEISLPPSDLSLIQRNNSNTGNSFQITSVTVQGSTRKNDDLADDSADDLDESHCTDISSDFLDSSRADIDGYHSEDNLDDLASPCGPIIFTHGVVDKNMNLSVGVTPTYAALGPVAAGGVTMMTSKSESPVSAQVPIMNPLPNNWQRRFKVVKIVSSEPFRRGRWLCMDFKDPPVDNKPERNGGQNTPPTIQITNCDSEDSSNQTDEYLNYAQVYEIPINQTFSGNFVMGNEQHMYGIILPQNEYVQPVTLVQDLSLQTTDRNFNNVVNPQSIMLQSGLYNASAPYTQSPTVGLTNCNTNHSPPSTQVSNTYSEAVLNQINSVNGNINWNNNVLKIRSRNNSESGTPPILANHGLPGNIKPVGINNDSDSSQTAPEKLPSSEVGQEVDLSGSAATTGTNTVAIDNKIEQAMDLVKSHLMFAVREEVEVLKEKITELLERISQLEHENDILRANASAETLKQLNSHKKSAAGGNLPPST